MILKSIKPKYIGPFYQNCEIKIEKDLTVITGANDTGKSVLLSYKFLL